MRTFLTTKKGKSQQTKARMLSLYLLRSFPRICLGIAVCLYLSFPAIAASNNNNNNNKKPQQTEFTPSPLEIETPDPLLPRKPTKNRPLTEEELTELEPALDQLNTEAAAKLQTGDREGAFEIWYRELRLRRWFGPLPEIKALGRVGAIAWEANRRDDVQIITKRLQLIQQEAQKKPPLELEFLRSLGTAYQQVRELKGAIDIYEQILAVARQQQDTAAEEATLLTLADLNLNWFDYTKAAATYRDLLRLAEDKSDRVKQVAYLRKLAYIYDQSKEHQISIKTKQQLIELFLNQQGFIEIPALQLSIGDNYKSLGLLEQAAQNYQEAYAFAFNREMFGRASDALQKLANLFQSTNQTQQALEVYQLLVSVGELAKDSYGMMNAYDQIGKIYLELKDYPKALNAFELGLAMAKQLQYREAYFAQQIEQVSKQK